MAQTLPLFPLATVLLPGASLPLHIFEARYRQLTTDLVTGALPDQSFGVLAIKPGWSAAEVDLGGLHEIGCTAVLHEVHQLPDGRFDIVTCGARRFRVIDIEPSSAPYLLGSIEWVPDTDSVDDEADLPVLAAQARQAHRHYCRTAWRREDWHEPAPDTDPRVLPHLLAADCLLALEDRQDLLQETRPAHRLRLVRQMLCREAEFLRTLRAVPLPFTQFAAEPSSN